MHIAKPHADLPAPFTPPDCCSSPFRAVQAGHLGCLVRYPNERLLEVDGRNKSVLHVAAKCGNKPIAEYVLKVAPVLLDVQNDLLETPLLIAAAYGHLHLVDLFLQNGSKDQTNRRALQRDINGTSVLLAALARNDNNMVVYLLRRFGRRLMTLPNKANMTAFHVAAAQGNLEVLHILIKFDRSLVDLPDMYGCRPSVYAVQSGSLVCVRYLVEKAGVDLGSTTAKGQSLLHVAALSGHVGICRWLMHEMGSNAVLSKTLDSATVIHCAAYSGDVPCLRLLMEPWSKKKRKLILGQRDSRDNSPLHLAVMNGHLAAVQCLLDYDTAVDLRNKNQQTPTMIAQLKGNRKMIRLLTEFEQNRSIKAKKSKSCADLAASPHPAEPGHRPSPAKAHRLKSVGSFLLNLDIGDRKWGPASAASAEENADDLEQCGTRRRFRDEALAAVSELDRVLAAHSQ